MDVVLYCARKQEKNKSAQEAKIKNEKKEIIKMKNLENIKALNDMEMAKVAGGNFFADLEEVLRQIFADKKPTQQDNPEFANPKFTTPKIFVARG